MAEQPGDTEEKKTPATPPVENKQQDPSEKGGQADDTADKKETEKEPMIPKHRFDEVAEQAKLGKQALDELARMKRAFNGEDSSPQLDAKVSKFSEKYNIKEEFAKDLLELSTAEAEKKLKAEMQPLRQQQAQAAFANEISALEKEFPDAVDMTKDERDEFIKMATSEKYRAVPLVELWKIKTFGRPPGKKKTAEASRSGGGKSADEEVDISAMSIADFEKYSASLSKKSGNKF